MKFKIITLPKERWQEYKELRLLAVSSEPVAFWPTETEEKERTIEGWTMYLDKNSPQTMFFAECNNELVGMIRLAINKEEKVKHNSWIYSFFVKSEARGSGIGKSLLTQAINFLKEKNVENICLNVAVTQKGAIKLYKSFGFKKIGKYKNLVKYNGKYYDEDIMCLSL